MKTKKWMVLTETAVVNMDMDGDVPNVDMSLGEWMDLLYEILSDHEHDDDNERDDEDD